MEDDRFKRATTRLFGKTHYPLGTLDKNSNGCLVLKLWISLWITLDPVDNLGKMRTVAQAVRLNSALCWQFDRGFAMSGENQVNVSAAEDIDALLSDSVGDGEDAIKNPAPVLDSEQLRAAVNRVSPRLTKDGKVYGVKDTSKGRITAKQRLFASLIVQGLSPREAYRKAYNCLTANESTIATSANRLMNDPKVSVLLQSSLDKREENLISDAVATRRHVMTELLNHARDMKSEGSKLKALELIGRAVGMFTDKVETKVEEVSTDQLKRELETHLALLDGATKH